MDEDTEGSKKNDQERLGALWIKENQKGKFMTGNLQLEGSEGPEIRIICFRNQKKSKPNSPDFVILKARDDPNYKAKAKKQQDDDILGDDREDNEPPF